MELTIGDRLELHELMARYANSIDDRDWARFETVFTDDCRYELAGFGRLNKVLVGRDALLAMMQASPDHPVAHHVTSVEVIVKGDAVRMRSKMAGHVSADRWGSADYHDVVVRTADGWRIADRLVCLRR